MYHKIKRHFSMSALGTGEGGAREGNMKSISINDVRKGIRSIGKESLNTGDGSKKYKDVNNNDLKSKNDGNAFLKKRSSDGNASLINKINDGNVPFTFTDITSDDEEPSVTFQPADGPVTESPTDSTPRKMYSKEKQHGYHSIENSIIEQELVIPKYTPKPAIIPVDSTTLLHIESDPKLQKSRVSSASLSNIVNIGSGNQKFAHVKSRVARYIKGDIKAFETKSRPSSSPIAPQITNYKSTVPDTDLKSVLKSILPDLIDSESFTGYFNDISGTDSDASDWDRHSNTSHEEYTVTSLISTVQIDCKQQNDPESSIMSPIIMGGESMWLQNKKFQHSSSLVPLNKPRPITGSTIRPKSSWKTFNRPKSSPTKLKDDQAPISSAAKPKTAHIATGSMPDISIISSELKIGEQGPIIISRPVTVIQIVASVREREREPVELEEITRIHSRPNSGFGGFKNLSRPGSGNISSRPSSGIQSKTSYGHNMFSEHTHFENESCCDNFSVGPWNADAKLFPKPKIKKQDVFPARIMELSQPRCKSAKFIRANESTYFRPKSAPAFMNIYSMSHLLPKDQSLRMVALPDNPNLFTGMPHEQNMQPQKQNIKISMSRLKTIEKPLKSSLRNPSVHRYRPLYMVNHEETSDHMQWSKISMNSLPKKPDRRSFERGHSKRVSFLEQEKTEYPYGDYLARTDASSQFKIVSLTSNLDRPTSIEISKVGW